MAVPGRFGKARSRSRTGRSEESDGRIVPMKPRTTPADGLVAESVEGRRPVEGRARANACPGHSAGTGIMPSSASKARINRNAADEKLNSSFPTAIKDFSQPSAYFLNLIRGNCDTSVVSSQR